MNRAKNVAQAKPTEVGYGFAPVTLQTWSEHGVESVYHLCKVGQRIALKELVRLNNGTPTAL